MARSSLYYIYVGFLGGLAIKDALFGLPAWNETPVIYFE